MKKITLVNKNASATVYDYAAHVTSWVGQSGHQRIFTSKQAIFEAPKAIRGGVPIIFPQFNEVGEFQRHGFARNVYWNKLDTQTSSAHFQLNSDAQTREIWPFEFSADYKVDLSAQGLSLSLSVKNTDSKPITFTVALHSYLQIKSLKTCSVSGVKNLSYWDNDGTDFSIRTKALTNELTFTDAIDRVYFDVKNDVVLDTGNGQLNISHSGFDDMVIWTPGKQAAKDMSDFADDEFDNMLCVEAAQIAKPITLLPNETWTGKQILTEVS
ncbi:D-hexose-6-phosphate mutarotase [Marinicellulosiphila megalodicopiae]|uniref:D-hexose-6-phosphate mutarotase n=1 Tax=Marinicellulosiphila megalodicopiae TaxID=2724896 RepID=UPI003BB026D0